MSSLKYSRAGAIEPARPAHESLRRLTALALRSMSAALAKLSRRIAQPASRLPKSMPQLEFYAEAGAPEGALYLDGRLVGWVAGVRRL
jgi:hypothetical protein